MNAYTSIVVHTRIKRHRVPNTTREFFYHDLQAAYCTSILITDLESAETYIIQVYFA